MTPPKFSRNLPIEEYIKLLDVYLGGKIGAMNFPMSWATRENVLDTTTPSPPMAHNQLYYTEHGSVSEEMVQHYSHGHNIYTTDNAAVYDLLDTALRDTKYHANIAPFKRIRDGRGSYLALNAQFCGPDLWDNKFKDNVAIIMTHNWNGNSNIDFEKFLSQQRHACIQCTRSVDNIQCVVPDEFS